MAFPCRNPHPVAANGAALPTAKSSSAVDSQLMSLSVQRNRTCSGIPEATSTASGHGFRFVKQNRRLSRFDMIVVGAKT